MTKEFDIQTCITKHADTLRALGASPQQTPPVHNTVYNEDCVDGMKRVPDGYADLIVADPPFGIGFDGVPGNYNRAAKQVVGGYKDVSATDYYTFTLKWMYEANRILTANGGMFVFSGWNNLGDVLTVGKFLGLDLINHIIWKYQFAPYTTRKYATSHYHVLYYAKPKARRTFNKQRHYVEDVLIVQRDYRAGKKRLPTQLPVALVEEFVLTGSNPGDVVIDPFFGSGTTGVAAQKHSRVFVGYEIVPEYAAFARDRIANGDAEKELRKLETRDHS